MITIFTPSFNRAHTLPVLYQSLLKQTNSDFEWIVVDDGSKDGTQALVEAWAEETTAFPIRYFYQENSGKHVAINLGVAHAGSAWFFIVDSDDYLVADAVAKIHGWIQTVETAEIAAVSGTRCYRHGGIIGQSGRAREGYIDAKNSERKRYKLLGDKAEVYRTAILRDFPFPVFPGEKFLAEAAVWDAIALAGYKVRWFPDPIVVCEYLDDGLTAQLRGAELEVRNFKGCTHATLVMLQAHGGIERLRIICQYINKARKKGLSIEQISREIQVNRGMLFALMIPVQVKNAAKKINIRKCGK